MSFRATACVMLAHPGNWIDDIHARLRSFGAESVASPGRHQFDYSFGHAEILIGPAQYELVAEAATEAGVARLQELMATAVELYAKPDHPVVRWTGDATQGLRPSQFREMRVLSATQLTPRMRRITLGGEDLARFKPLSSLHIRMLFPREGSQWPSLGQNGLAVWPQPETKPDLRVYTVRRVDVAAGTMDVDFVLHGEEGIGGRWSAEVQPGGTVGILGPVGRPLRFDKWVTMGADETGIPAVSRLIEYLPTDVCGEAILEVEDEDEIVPINTSERFTVTWLLRKDRGSRLVEEVLSRRWSQIEGSFGWFAAEREQAGRVRAYWREELGLSRDRTLVAGYWARGENAPMTG